MTPRTARRIRAGIMAARNKEAPPGNLLGYRAWHRTIHATTYRALRVNRQRTADLSRLDLLDGLPRAANAPDDQ